MKHWIFFFFPLLLFSLDVDLRHPVYENGVIYADEGGIITTEEFRIQATCLSYSKEEIIASGNLLFEMGATLFVGDSLHYDRETGIGKITNGRSGAEPWYFGGRLITIYPNHCYTIEEGFATTSEDSKASFKLAAKELRLLNGQYLTAKDVAFYFGPIPLFWLPTFSANLRTISDHPFTYTIRAGGRQGPRIGMRYELFSWDLWNAHLRLDYHIEHGFGGGFEGRYHSVDQRENFRCINYFARDFSLSIPHRRHRYRFQGVYERMFANNATSVRLTYDKISDKDMPSDYDDKGIEIETAERTQLHVRHQDPLWIANFTTRIRANTFQTVKQELPTVDVRFLPLTLGNSGVIAENEIKASYLDFEYNNRLRNVEGYTSPRVEYSHLSYRPFSLGTWTATPEAGLMAIYYGNSPDRSDDWTILGLFGGEVKGAFYRQGSGLKHIIEPYITYQYFTSPTTNPDDHFIFDMSDGWTRLNRLRVGTRHHLFQKGCEVHRPLFIDLYTNAFFHTPTIPQTIPKVYADCTAYLTPRLKQTVSFGWDFEENLVDHCNIWTEYTVNEDTALAFEYRHRSSFDFRKVDRDNYILDAFRTSESLRDSALSDQRDTLIVHLFHRFLPQWSIEFKGRYGWNREQEREYREVECKLHGSIRSTWQISASYQYKEDDRRFTLAISSGFNRPTQPYHCQTPRPLF